MLVVLAPAPLLATRSGPKTEQNRTASHIAEMASDAHISLTSTREYHRGRWAAVGGTCAETVDMSITPSGSGRGRRRRPRPRNDRYGVIATFATPSRWLAKRS